MPTTASYLPLLLRPLHRRSPRRRPCHAPRFPRCRRRPAPRLLHLRLPRRRPSPAPEHVCRVREVNGQKKNTLCIGLDIVGLDINLAPFIFVWVLLRLGGEALVPVEAESVKLVDHKIIKNTHFALASTSTSSSSENRLSRTPGLSILSRSFE